MGAKLNSQTLVNRMEKLFQEASDELTDIIRSSPIQLPNTTAKLITSLMLKFYLRGSGDTLSGIIDLDIDEGMTGIEVYIELAMGLNSLINGLGRKVDNDCKMIKKKAVEELLAKYANK